MNISLRAFYKPFPTLFCAMACAALLGCENPTVQRDAAPAIALMANTYANGKACILDREFSVNSLTMNLSESTVIQMLGEPQEKRPIPPGTDEFRRIIYPGLNLLFANQVVVELHVTDAPWQTPSGLRVGLTQAELTNILGQVPERIPFSPSQKSEILYKIPLCQDEKELILERYFLIYTDTSGTVTEIRMLGDWP